MPVDYTLIAVFAMVNMLRPYDKAFVAISFAKLFNLMQLFVLHHIEKLPNQIGVSVSNQMLLFDSSRVSFVKEKQVYYQQQQSEVEDYSRGSIHLDINEQPMQNVDKGVEKARNVNIVVFVKKYFEESKELF